LTLRRCIATLVFEHCSKRVNPFVMSFYTGQTQEHFLNPRNVGEVLNAEAVGSKGSFNCGAFVRLTLGVDAATHHITEAKFKAIGCGYLIAAASLVTETIKGLSIGEAMNLSEAEISARLGEVPAPKTQCIELCHEALHAAAVHYRVTTLEEWIGDEALICTCFGVSENHIEDAIAARSLSTVEEVTSICNAGGGCGSCQPLIQDMLDDYRRTAGI
jgi:NifU-like protein